MIDGGNHTDAPLADDRTELTSLVLSGLQHALDDAQRARLDQLVDIVPGGMELVEELSRTWALAAVAQSGTRRSEGVAMSRRGFMAAGVAGLAVAGGMSVWLSTRGKDYVAPVDAPMHARLADGTQVTLSPGGQMRVHMDEGRRYAKILQGETFWDVAHDAHRPFEVAIEAFRLTVLGTQFNVQPGPAGLRVDLLAGALRVRGGDAGPVVLAPGQRFWARHNPLVALADVSGQAAWVDGRLVFEDASLSDVAARVKLQTGQRIEFADDAVSQLRFSGILAINDVPGWQLGLQAVLPVKVSRTADGLKLYPRPAPNAA